MRGYGLARAVRVVDLHGARDVPPIGDKQRHDVVLPHVDRRREPGEHGALREQLTEEVAAALRARAVGHDVVPLLVAYGRDVAGAVQIYDPNRSGEPVSPHATPLGDDGVGRLLRGIQAQPLGNAPVTGKSSLAGVQEKVVVARLDGAWHQVHDGYPSTHIIKLTPPEHPTLIFDEEYGTRIACLLGLTDRPAWPADFDGVPGLVIERYDRSDGGRIHQEGFNQVLGARGDQKYQAIGGQVSLRRIAQVFAARPEH